MNISEKLVLPRFQNVFSISKLVVANKNALHFESLLPGSSKILSYEYVHFWAKAI